MSNAPTWDAYIKSLRPDERRKRKLVSPLEHRLIYVAAPYSKVEDKTQFMSDFMQFCGNHMMNNEGDHLVSPLFNHFSLDKVPGMAGDYAFWGDYSRNLLKRCDELWVLKHKGWDQSTGVADEIKTAEELGIPVVYLHPNF